MEIWLRNAIFFLGREVLRWGVEKRSPVALQGDIAARFGPLGNGFFPDSWLYVQIYGPEMHIEQELGTIAVTNVLSRCSHSTHVSIHPLPQ